MEGRMFQHQKIYECNPLHQQTKEEKLISKNERKVFDKIQYPFLIKKKPQLLANKDQRDTRLTCKRRFMLKAIVSSKVNSETLEPFSVSWTAYCHHYYSTFHQRSQKMEQGKSNKQEGKYLKEEKLQNLQLRSSVQKNPKVAAGKPFELIAKFIQQATAETGKGGPQGVTLKRRSLTGPPCACLTLCVCPLSALLISP